jgi:ANTAR domain
MNVYGHAPDSFDQRSIDLGELYAVPAAISVHNAQVLAQARRVADRLQRALTSRSAIDQAVGILISRSGCDADEAFAKLVAASQADNRKVTAVAQQLIDDAPQQHLASASALVGPAGSVAGTDALGSGTRPASGLGPM